eukprot:symbB.v1.2.014781.t1/scaffold1059.1/size140537/9
MLGTGISLVMAKVPKLAPGHVHGLPGRCCMCCQHLGDFADVQAASALPKVVSLKSLFVDGMLRWLLGR